ncbi:MAG: recombinase [Pseudonocardiales bacterium]|nr:recombinase [Pseudonocardiales bacterium]
MATRTRRISSTRPIEHQKRAIVYTRMSLDKTGEGAGIERQTEACSALALARGWDVIEVVEDTISATKVKMTDRPGWSRVLGMIQRNEVDVIVAWHLDRVTRSSRDLLDLIDLAVAHNVAIATATGDIDLSNETGRLVSKILGAVAEAEGERKAARQVLANEQRATAGRPMWVRRPFGYELDGSLRAVEADLVRQAYTDVLNGKSLSQVTREWDASGCAPHSAKTWGIASVRTILRSARNAGLSTYYGDVVGDATWTAIVDESTWRAAERFLTDPSRHTGGPGRTENLLTLTGVTVCHVCGSDMRIQWRGLKGAEGSYAIYQCQKGCSSMPVDWLDSRILIELTRQAAKLDISALTATDTPDLARLRAEAAELHERMAVLAEDFADGVINRATMLAGTQRGQARLTEVETEIAKAGRVGIWEYVDVEHLFEEFDGYPLEVQRGVIKAVFSKIEIKPRGRGRVAPKREHIILHWSPEWRAASKVAVAG